MTTYRGPPKGSASEPYFAEVECPIHHVIMRCSSTRYGFRHSCPIQDCTMACWDGPTSLPADAPTRGMRHKAHSVFDALWKGRGKGKRDILYRRLAKELGIDSKACHMGMFDSATCKRVIKIAHGWCHASRHSKRA